MSTANENLSLACWAQPWFGLPLYDAATFSQADKQFFLYDQAEVLFLESSALATLINVEHTLTNRLVGHVISDDYLGHTLTNRLIGHVIGSQ